MLHQGSISFQVQSTGLFYYTWMSFAPAFVLIIRFQLHFKVQNEEVFLVMLNISLDIYIGTNGRVLKCCPGTAVNIILHTLYIVYMTKHSACI